MSMTYSTPATAPINWELIGDMYEDFDYLSITRVKPLPIASLSIVKSRIGSGDQYFVKNRMFKFAYRYIYKDLDISPISNFSSPQIIYSGEGKNAFTITVTNEGSEIKHVELLVNINNLGWVVADKKPTEESAPVEFVFDNTGTYTSIGEYDSTRYQNYSPKRVDASTSINNRIVDGGMDEGEDSIPVDFELKYVASLGFTRTITTTNTVETREVDSITNDYNITGLRGNSFVKYQFKITNTNPEGKLKGGTNIVLRGFAIPDNKPSGYYSIVYNTKDADLPLSIVNYINNNKPIHGISDSTGKYKFDMRARLEEDGYIVVEVGFYHPDFSIPVGRSQGEIVTTNGLFPIDIGNKIIPSVSKNSSITFGVELADRFGRFHPVNKLKTISIPSQSKLAQDNGFSVDDVIKVGVQGKITGALPSWAYSYRFVYFGSDKDSFIQFPSVMPFRSTYYPDALRVFDGYMHLKRIANISPDAKTRIPTLAVDSIADIRIGNFFNSNLKVETSTSVFKTSGAPSIGEDTTDNNCLIYTTEYNNPSGSPDYPKVVDIKNPTQKGTIYGYTGDNVGTSINTWIDVNVYNCFIKSTFNSIYFIETNSCINGSFEEMLLSDAFDSTTIGWGRTNIYYPDYKKKYFKGKLRNGGNYLENTNINNITNFELLDYAFVDDQYGKITQMYPVGQNLRIRQERNSSTVYIGNIQSVSPDGTTQTLQSSKFLGFVDAGSMNVGSKYGDWFKIGSQEFFFDDATKNVYRQSQAGTFSISGKAFTQEGGSDYKIHKLITDIALSNNTKNIAFGYDNENDILLLTFLGIENKTIGFHYPTQRWLSYYSFIPENYVSAGVTNYYWEGGKMYKMNKGERKPITYQFTSNANPSLPKKFRSMEIIGDLVNFNMNCTIPSGSNYRDMYTRSNKIVNKENKKYIELPRNMKTTSNTPSIAEKDSGIEMRGQFANFELTGNLKLTSINVNND